MQTTPSIDIGHLLDSGHGSSYQRRLVLLTALTIVFDGIDNQLIGIAVPTMMREWALPRSAFAPVISLGYLGMMTAARQRAWRAIASADGWRCWAARWCSAR